MATLITKTSFCVHLIHNILWKILIIDANNNYQDENRHEYPIFKMQLSKKPRRVADKLLLYLIVLFTLVLIFGTIDSCQNESSNKSKQSLRCVERPSVFVKDKSAININIAASIAPSLFAISVAASHIPLSIYAIHVVTLMFIASVNVCCNRI